MLEGSNERFNFLMKEQSEELLEIVAREIYKQLIVR
jgi:hypothetical protein